jgi:LPXTG-site transpeptidase (sortase) family protein
VLLATGVELIIQGSQPHPVAPRPTSRSQPTRLINSADFPNTLVVPTTAPSSHEGERIRVPELGIDLPLVPGDGWNTPLNKAAQYPGLGWPGEGHRSVVYAHAQVGMFGPLFRASPGQHVDIVRGDRQTLHYVITEYYARWPITDTRWLKPLDEEQLVLITCTTYNPNDPRIVAVAQPE